MAEDIPEGHVTLQSPGAMMPVQEGQTVYDFYFDPTSERCGVWLHVQVWGHSLSWVWLLACLGITT